MLVSVVIVSSLLEQGFFHKICGHMLYFHTAVLLYLLKKIYKCCTVCTVVLFCFTGGLERGGGGSFFLILCVL